MKMNKKKLSAEAFVSHVALKKSKVNVTVLNKLISEFSLNELKLAHDNLKSLNSNFKRAKEFYNFFGLKIKGIVEGVLLNKLRDHQDQPTQTGLLIKNDVISESFRKVGNQLYARSQFHDALRCYTLTCCYAPAGSKNLALAFSNRSACFMQMKKFKLALRDILQFETVANSLNSESDANVIKRVQERKKRLLEELGEHNGPNNANVNDHPSEFFKLKNPNPSVPCAESFIGIKNDDVRGRHVRNIGDKVIEPGTLLILEQPFSKILFGAYNFELLHCSVCLKDLNGSGFPCKGCVFHVFCSTECSKKSTHSRYECQIAHCLHELNLDRTHHLALVTCLKLSGADLLVQAKTNNECLSKPSTSPLLLPGFSNNNVYDSTSYHAIHNLMWHEEIVTEMDLKNYLLYSTIVAELLHSLTDYFNVDDDIESATEVSHEIKINFIACMLRHLMNFPCNAHSLYKMNSDDDCSEEIGAGAFALLSMINHSCDPNVVRATLPNGLTCVVAIQHILPGGEVLDNYGKHYAVMDRATRISQLQTLYNFKCDCPACIEDWCDIEKLMAMLDESSDKVCPKCSLIPLNHPVDSIVLKPGKNDGGYSCLSCGFSVSKKDWTKEFDRHVEIKEQTYDTIISDKKSSPVNAYESSALALKYFDSRFRRPYKYISACQEMVKQCLFLWVKRDYF